MAVAEADLAPAIPGTDLDARLDAIDWPDDDSQRAIWPVARDLLRAWHLVNSDPAAAIEIATGIVERRANVARLLDRISAVLVRAVGYRRLGRNDVAAAQLDEALALAAPEDARQVFVDCGKPVRALLTVLVPAESRFAGFAAGILQRFESPIGPRAIDHRAGKGELTESEREIMRYLSSHLTNEEIAEDLCLSVNTVKTHLRAIYRKLGVSSRRAAIAEADARGLS
jgi:LuxR family maltose regulon positive regulatory protein